MDPSTYKIWPLQKKKKKNSQFVRASKNKKISVNLKISHCFCPNGIFSLTKIWGQNNPWGSTHPKYWNTLILYHNSLVLKEPIFYLSSCLKTVGGVANSADSDQILQLVASNLDLHYLFKSAHLSECPNIHVQCKYKQEGHNGLVSLNWVSNH